MQIFIISLFSMMIVNAMLSTSLQQQIDSPKEVTDAIVQVDQYRMFSYVASQYMKSYSGGAGTVTWSAMASASGMPSGAKGATMPANWKVVVASDGTWVTCTQLTEQSLAILDQLAVGSGADLRQTTVGGTNFLVVGATSDVSKASQCS